MMAHYSIQYGHWGITVSKRVHANDYAPCEPPKVFGYPVVSGYGPCETEKVKAEARAYLAQMSTPHPETAVSP